MMPAARFATAINCIDGRIQAAVTTWIQQTYGVDYVDLITEPAPDRELAQGWVKGVDLRLKAEISARAHGSTLVSIAAHHDCARNPVSRDEHVDQVIKAIQTIRSWHLFHTILGLWVNERWEVELIDSVVEETADAH